MINHKYWVYILTNPSKTVLYVGVTNNLARRLQQHFENRGINETYAGRYFCYNLLYWEEFKYIDKAITREKQIKKWSRAKKEHLIAINNPGWEFKNNLFPYKRPNA